MGEEGDTGALCHVCDIAMTTPMCRIGEAGGLCQSRVRDYDAGCRGGLSRDVEMGTKEC